MWEGLMTRTHTHAHTQTLPFSLSLSLSHTHTHTHTRGDGRYARKGSKEEPWSGPNPEQYSEATRRSMAAVDESIINYDALTDLMCLLVTQQQQVSWLDRLWAG